MTPEPEPNKLQSEGLFMTGILMAIAGIWLWASAIKAVLYDADDIALSNFIVGTLLIIPAWYILARVTAARNDPYYGLPMYAAVAAALTEWETKAASWPEEYRAAKLKELDLLWMKLENTEVPEQDVAKAERRAQAKAFLLKRKHACWLSTP